ncbi:MAG: hypothetical protein ACHQQQ_00590 [Bacteroidota bacterium]
MPRIQMTRPVKIALFFLRIYLIALLLLILVKFVLLFSKPAPAKTSTPQQQTSSDSLHR